MGWFPNALTHQSKCLLPVMVYHCCVGLFIEICTAGLPKNHLRNKNKSIKMAFCTEDRELYSLGIWRTGIALFGSSPFINCTFTVMLRADPWRLAKLRLCGFTYSRFLEIHVHRHGERRENNAHQRLFIDLSSFANLCILFLFTSYTVDQLWRK